jgi:hypothetical protein
MWDMCKRSSLACETLDTGPQVRLLTREVNFDYPRAHQENWKAGRLLSKLVSKLVSQVLFDIQSNCVRQASAYFIAENAD